MATHQPRDGSAGGALGAARQHRVFSSPDAVFGVHAPFFRLRGAASGASHKSGLSLNNGRPVRRDTAWHLSAGMRIHRATACGRTPMLSATLLMLPIVSIRLVTCTFLATIVLSRFLTKLDGFMPLFLLWTGCSSRMAIRSASFAASMEGWRSSLMFNTRSYHDDLLLCSCNLSSTLREAPT